MKSFLAAATWILLAAGILTCWITSRWAVGAYQAGVFLLAAIWLANRILKPEKITLSPVLIPPAGVIALGLIQIAFGITINRWETMAAVLTWSCHLAVMAMVLDFASSSRLREKFLEGFLWFAVVVVVQGVIQNFTSPGRVFWLFDSGYDSLVLGPFVYHNKFAQFIELCLPLALFRAVRSRRQAGFSLLMAAALLGGSVASGSRSGFVFAVLETILFLLIVRRGGWLERQGMLRVAVQGGLLLAVAGGVMGWEYLGQRFRIDPLTDVRIPIVRSTADMIRERPWTGFGLGAWDKAYPAYATYDDGLYVNQAHCDWLQWPAEGGLPMLALMLLMAAFSWRLALRNPWSLGVFVVLAHGLVDYPMQQVPQFATLCLAFLAMAAAEASSANKLAFDRMAKRESYPQLRAQ